jgi:hypothetical protein
MPSLHCSVCDLTGAPTSILEAQQWAEIHDQLQHHGQPTAAVVLRSRGGFLPRRRGLARAS